MRPLQEKTAIVTGGSRGIGRAIVERLHSDGVRVLACGRSERPADLHPDVTWMRGDVSKTSDAESIVSSAVLHLGGVSILVNNAGVQIEKTILQTSDDDWNTLIGINCKGVFNMSRACISIMADNGGNIVNVGSISSHVADPSMAIYNASKAFVHGLTRSIAVDHGPKIRCNAVCPGWIMTEMAADGFALARDPVRAKADALARHAVRRLGTPDDVANAVSWLVSDQSAFVTGQCFTIDGGLTAASPLQPGLF